MLQAVAAGSRSTTVFNVTCAILCLATVFLAMRLFSKLWLVRKPTWDDFVVSLAWVLAIGLSSAIMFGSTVGLGKVDAEILPEWQEPLKQSAYAFTVLYNPALTACKLSILMLYYRMSQARPFFRFATLMVGLVVILNGIVLTFLSIFRCRPISGAFNDKTATCIDIVTLYLCAAPINVLTDIALLVLPLPMVTAMRLDVHQKVGLIATFMTGLFVTVVDVVRIAYLQEAFIQQINADISGSLDIGQTNGAIADFWWHASYSFMWSAIEVNVGLICACALVVKPLLIWIVPSKSQSSGAAALDVGEDGRANRSPLAAPATSLPTTSAQAGQDIHHAIGPNEEDHEMDLFECLATSPPPVETTQTRPHRKRRLTSASILEPLRGRRTSATSHEACQQPPTTFMDFVNLCGTKPLTELTRREAWWPVVFVSILFWTWGFAYGLINSLTGQLQSGSGYNSAQGIILHNTYYCGYIIGPLAAYYIFTRVGFKATFITGLAVFTIATLSFWPSSSLVSFPGFSVSNILIGSGLSILQVAANPYVALAGPDELMESRLNFARGFQAIGQMVSPLLAIKVLFKRVGRPGLFSSQWLYLAISLSASLLGVVFYYVPLCEASNDDLELVASRREIRKGISKQAHVWRINIMLVVAIAGIFGMWLYIGAQEQLRYFWNDLMAEVKPGSTPSKALDYYTASLATFTMGRFLASLACYLGVPGRIVLGISSLGCLLMSILSMLLPARDGALASFMLLTFFQGPFLPTSFAMTLRGLGRHTKLVSTGLTMALSGGGVWPSISWAVQRDHNGSDRYMMRVSVIIYTVMLVIIAVVNLHPTIRHWVDADRDATAAPFEAGQDILLTTLGTV